MARWILSLHEQDADHAGSDGVPHTIAGEEGEPHAEQGEDEAH
jgi:hypothetical protein